MLNRILTPIHTGLTVYATGITRSARPDRLLGAGMGFVRYGATLAGGYEAGASLYPDRVSVHDETRTLTYREIRSRTNALASALEQRGIGEGDRVGIMCRNHAGLVEASTAAAKVGADVLFLNTGFSGPQLADVTEREGAGALFYDGEFTPVVGDARFDGVRVVTDAGSAGDGTLHVGRPNDPHIAELIAEGDEAFHRRVEHHSRLIVLTSGTTGTPKGAQREAPRSLAPAATLLSKIPLRTEANTFVAPPLFHAWGMAHWMVTMALGAPMFLRRRFDPEATLAVVDEHRIDTLVLVPVMLQRILELPAAVRNRYDTSSLRVIALSGSQLHPDLATKGLETFGDVLYNLYGSTEVAYATIAEPRDLKAAPGTAGRVPWGVVVKLYDSDGNEITEPNTTGRIFAGSQMSFEGYTGGGGKEVIDGLLSTGDVGYFDEAGRLFVQGRDDDMIVSGGENVFPQEVEELLAGHEAVADVAVVGVDDEQFGQRLAAAVVPRDGHQLSEKEVKAYVKARLASYKAPGRVLFLDELPRNPTGKVLKRELAERFSTGVGGSQSR